MNAPPPPAGSIRLPSLDFLRFVAIVLVLGHHLQGWGEIIHDPATKTVWQILTRGGWIGVDLFFVLSGFLVSGLLFQEYRKRRHLAIGRFYIRRGWKIYPSFYVFVAITTAIAFALRQPPTTTQILSDCFFLQSYLPCGWDHMWSLAVEEHFYIILPLLLALIARCSVNRENPFGQSVPIMVGVLALVFLGLRLTTGNLHPVYEFRIHLTPTHLRMDSLFFGVLISYYYNYHREVFTRRLRPWRQIMIASGFALFSLNYIFPKEQYELILTIGFTLNYLAAGAILVGVIHSEWPNRQMFRFCAAVGQYSYSIYLWHLPLFWLLLPVFERKVLKGELPFVPRLIFYFTMAFAVGIIMSKLIEYPALRLRDRWFPRRD